ncbi:MAG TPA: FAD-dependent oxidoreductase [Candidatus Competibacteraceae bacterium]|nr:FAD-dependent oxidoreductase [Candidatus Competibacteraceae bacterium]
MTGSDPALPVDILIVGGGIAGLWLLARLRARGYGALLVESDRLGSGQTLCSQGIIHGGAKYSLHGQLSDSAQTIAGMPTRWRDCLAGRADVDLRGARLLAEHQYLWATQAPTSRLAAFFASKLMRSRMEKVANRDAVETPPALHHPAFQGAIYRLDEPIVDTASILAALATRHRDTIVLNQGPLVPNAEGTFTLRQPGQPPQTLRPTVTVYTAGAGNAALPWATPQLRPLHMVMARGAALPGPLYAHCLGVSEVPRLTVTSHYDASDRLIWYLGGGLAEEGVSRDRAGQIVAARHELRQLLPWVDWNTVEFATFTIQRAEAHQAGGRRPASYSVLRDGRMIVAWPTKLALAPLLAERIETLLPDLGLQPRPLQWPTLAAWPRPALAAYPWDREDMAWS